MGAARQKTSVEDLLSVPSRDMLPTLARSLPSGLSVGDAKRLTQHFQSLNDTLKTIRLGVIHTYTSDLLDPWLDLAAAVEGCAVETYHAPYGLNILEAQDGSGLSNHQPDTTLVMLRREDLHPDLRHPVSGFDGKARERLREEIADNLSGIVGHFRNAVSGQIIVTVLPPSLPPSLGLYDRQAEASEAAWWTGVKDLIAARFRDGLQATMLLDLDEMMADIGRQNFYDLRFWYATRFPFTPAAAAEFARRVIYLAATPKHIKAKVIVLDADNTMWGGVVGEDGFDGIALGPEYPGNAFVDFQRRILDYQQRGFILAICSKNNAADVDEVLDNHPHQVLRDEHFAAKRVNWEPKSRNLASLAEELNLGLDSFIFVDDSDYECALVRRELPQVEVVQAPSNPVELPSVLERLSRLEILSMTSEDRAKTRLYAEERKRREHQAGFDAGGSDIGDYLKSLAMKMRVEIDNPARLARLAQLTMKTNQFNLTTRRYSEQDVSARIEAEDWIVASFSLSDVFGDSGVVGLIMAQQTAPDEALIDTVLMSCRVIGRQAESAFFETIMARLAARGVKRVYAEYLPTPKNGLVKDFLPQHGFAAEPDGRHVRSLETNPPPGAEQFPIDVEMA